MPFKDKEKGRQYKQEWYRENKNRLLDDARKRYQENREAKCKASRQYRQNNIAKVKASQHRYYLKHKEKIKANIRRWAKEDQRSS